MNKKVVYGLAGAIVLATVAGFIVYKKNKASKHETETSMANSEDISENISEEVVHNEFEKPSLYEITKKYYNDESFDHEDKEEKYPQIVEPIILNEIYDDIKAEDEFGTLVDYETLFITRFKDSVYVDELTGMTIDDAEDISKFAGQRVNEYFDSNTECDFIYVRNDVEKIDYEIVRDERTYDEYLSVINIYSDYSGYNPYQEESDT